MPALHRLGGILVFFLAATATAQTEYEALREPAMRRLGAQIEASQLEAARQDLAAYVALYPGDAIMQYNLACVTAMSGEADSALVCLRAALAAGYRDFPRVRTSPDLSLLADDPRLDALLEAVQTDLLTRMLDDAFPLEEGEWSDERPLRPDPFGPLPRAHAGSARFQFDDQTLTVAFTLPEGGADELIAVVALPYNLELHETARWFEFRTTLTGPGPVTMTGRHGRDEALPGAARLERAAGGWTLDIPWSSLHPNRPPIELMLGLNVVLRRRVDPVGPAQRWELIGDPHAGSRVQPWRRFVPVDLDPGPDPTPLLAGRLDNYLVIGDSLSVELGLQAAAGGPAVVALRSGAPALAATPDTTLLVDLESDLTFFTARYLLGHLPAPGWFQVAAEVTDAGGTRYTWQDRGFRLPPDWFVRQQERLETVRPAERAIVQFQLMRTLRGQQAFHPHDDPTSLAGSALAAVTFMDRAESTGSVLPRERTSLEAAFPTGTDALLACQLVMPEESARRGGEVLLVVVPERDLARDLAAALDDLRPAGDPRFFMVTAVQQVPGQPQTATTVIARALKWVCELTEPGAVRLVGIESGAEMALHAALADPQAWQALLLLAGEAFDPLVLAEPLTTVQELRRGLGSLPVVLSLPPALQPRTQALADLLRGGLPGLELERRSGPPAGPPQWAERVLAWRP